MKGYKDSKKIFILLFIILAVCITIGVMFMKPQVGIADQGDFDRVMASSGLSLLDSDKNNPNFIRFYKYIVTDYKISGQENPLMLCISSSISYLIIIITSICKLLGQSIFKTQYLAIAYSLIYIFAFSVILKSINIKNNLKLILLGLLTLFIFFDGNYLIWFNSLYGEPMVLITLLLLISSVLHYTYYKYVTMDTEKLLSRIVYILFAAFLFLGSKMQVSMTLLVILILLLKIIYDNKHILSKNNLIFISFLLCLVIIYPIGINITSKSLSKDTQYNSVFYGILNGSDTPKQDLIDLGLNPDMSVEAGKHSYLNQDEYVKYVPRTEITEKEFYSKIGNGKLVKFYLMHPLRLLKGMEYTANKAFYTSTSLGKNYESYSETPVTKFHRFTLWSSFRENVLPKNLYFIISVYLIVFLFSFYKYFISKSNPDTKLKILLLWCVMLISVLQFPMPFVGNGQADTAKQLFLFNFIFDGMLMLIYNYILFKVIYFFGSIRQYCGHRKLTDKSNYIRSSDLNL